MVGAEDQAMENFESSSSLKRASSCLQPPSLCSKNTPECAAAASAIISPFPSLANGHTWTEPGSQSKVRAYGNHFSIIWRWKRKPLFLVRHVGKDSGGSLLPLLLPYEVRRASGKEDSAMMRMLMFPSTSLCLNTIFSTLKRNGMKSFLSQRQQKREKHGFPSLHGSLLNGRRRGWL